MKKTLLLASLSLAALLPAAARNITPVNVQGDITSNTRWTNDKQYLLKGYVYVDSNVTLTIDSGVTVFGDEATKGALIIERGAKIFANGTKDYPIVFTSNKNAGSRNYGDWGGVILCGKTPTNWQADHQVEGGPRSLYGGNDPLDNSGRMSYVRIEFGGIPFSIDNEVNSLSLYAVGSGTQLDHIQCSYNGDDAIEWFGGTVNAKYLVAFKSVDDDFDNDLNFSGKNQFCIAMREPYVADASSGSKNMECDAYQGGTYSGIPYLANMDNVGVWSNLTLVGPQKSPGATNYNTANSIAGIHIRRGAGLSILNSIIVGWPVGVLIDESSASYGSTVANITNGSLQFRNNIIAGTAPISGKIAPLYNGPKEIFYVKDGARSNTPTTTMADTVTGSPFGSYAGPVSFLTATANNNRLNAADNLATGGLGLTDPFNLGNPNPLPAAGSMALTGADFTGTSKANDPYFTPTTYVGAFGATNWMAGWTEFNPNSANYDTLRFKRPDSGVGVSNLGSIVKGASVYPNPAANFANVVFDVIERTNLTVGLYDLTGKLLQTAFSGEIAAATHAVKIDLANVPAGFYMIRISSANGQSALPLVVGK